LFKQNNTLMIKCEQQSLTGRCSHFEIEYGVNKMSIENKLKELNIVLPEAPKPAGSYVPAVICGRMVFVAGQLPAWDGELKYTGKVGRDLSADDAYQAARVCAINGLGVLKAYIGDLDRIEQVVRVGGFVNSADGFTMQPRVINGASDLLVEVFGEQGKHARAAVGVNELPLNAAVEVEMLVYLKP
jgi:enamine deaminase RidA (YjgF/YER057c/UK114 family)